jgi:hypothetical protein
MVNNNTFDWAFNSDINWIRELALLIQNKLEDVPEIIVQTIGLDVTFQSLFVKCEMNKENLLSLKPVKNIWEMIDQIDITRSLKNPHFCNEYVLKKKLTEKFIEIELDELRLKCQNIIYKTDIKTLKKENEEVWEENKSLNNLLYVAQTKIKKRRKGKRTKITFDLAIKLYPDIKKTVSSQAERCRFKNGKINTSKLGSLFNIDHKTAKSWCQKLNIPLIIPSLN